MLTFVAAVLIPFIAAAVVQVVAPAPAVRRGPATRTSLRARVARALGHLDRVGAVERREPSGLA